MFLWPRATWMHRLRSLLFFWTRALLPREGPRRRRVKQFPTMGPWWVGLWTMFTKISKCHCLECRFLYSTLLLKPLLFMLTPCSRQSTFHLGSYSYAGRRCGIHNNEWNLSEMNDIDGLQSCVLPWFLAKISKLSLLWLCFGRGGWFIQPAVGCFISPSTSSSSPFQVV